jgi:subtilisin family serine protease
MKKHLSLRDKHTMENNLYIGKMIFKIIILFITILLSISISVSGQIINKIDSRLLNANPLIPQNIMVVMNDLADVSFAKCIHGKDAKAAYVYSTLISHEDNIQSGVKSFLDIKGVSYRSYYIVNMIALKANLELINELAQQSGVNRILLDGKVMMVSNPVSSGRDEGHRAIEWNITHMGATEVWSMGYTGQNVTIGGQDTGYEWENALLKNKYKGWNGSSADHNYNWHDAIRADILLSAGTNSCGFNTSEPCDDHNHGTHTMGTMVGDDGAGNQIGVAPGAKWIGCRNMENGYGSPTTYLECLEWFLAPYPLGSNTSAGDPTKMPHVINNSWGCPPEEGCDTSVFNIMEVAVNNLKLAGCVVVVSAGNSGSSCGSITDPEAIFEGSLTVGATDINDNIAGFSSRGPVTVDGSNRLKPNVSAPGVSIRSCIRGTNNFGIWQGTSMAGPHVAGLVALLISANPKLAGEVDVIEDIIEQTAVRLTSPFQNCGSVSGLSIPNNTFGYGRIDALNAINLALPSNYTPYIKQNEAIIIDNAGSGLILVSQNNQKYRISATNSGSLKIDSVSNGTLGSFSLAKSSLNLVNADTKIIFKSPDNSYWQLNIDDSGAMTISSLSNLPVINSKIKTGDVLIADGIKGLVLKSPGNICFMTNITNSGRLIAIPSDCIN